MKRAGNLRARIPSFSCSMMVRRWLEAKWCERQKGALCVVTMVTFEYFLWQSSLKPLQASLLDVVSSERMRTRSLKSSMFNWGVQCVCVWTFRKTATTNGLDEVCACVDEGEEEILGGQADIYIL